MQFLTLVQNFSASTDPLTRPSRTPEDFNPKLSASVLLIQLPAGPRSKLSPNIYLQHIIYDWHTQKPYELRPYGIQQPTKITPQQEIV